MKLVNLMTRAELFKAFKALPYVIHNKRFLIPQRPFHPTYNKVHFRSDLLGPFQRKYPEMVTEDLRLKVADESNRNQLESLYLRKNAQQRLKYYEEILEYSKRYILPLNQMNSYIWPQDLYFHIHSSQLHEQLVKQNKRYSYRSVSDIYHALSEGEKRVYEKKAQELISAKMEASRQAYTLYKIPNLTVSKSHILYLRDVKKEEITNEMLGEFKQQPKEVQLSYKNKFKQLKEEKEAELMEFLGRFKVSRYEFEHIKDVCGEIASLKAVEKNLKANKKREKMHSEKNIGEGMLEGVEVKPKRDKRVKNDKVKAVSLEQDSKSTEEFQQQSAGFQFEQSDASEEQVADPNENLDFINQEDFIIEGIKANIKMARQDLKQLKKKK